MISRQRKGFTLIELLVVIAIIALLMSILMPALRNVRDQAKDSMCRQRLQQWGVMFNMYAGEFDGKLMDFNVYSGVFMENGWIPLMHEYATSFDIFLCPSATELWSYGLNPNDPKSAWDFQFIVQGELSAGEWFPYYNVGTEENPIFAYGSYAKNKLITDPSPNFDEDTRFYRNIRVRFSARIPLCGDGNWAGAWPGVYDEPAQNRLHGPVDGPSQLNRFNLDRHNLSVNWVFLDWSVRKVGLKQLWQCRWSREMVDIDGVMVNGWGRVGIVPDPEDQMAWPEWMRNSKNYDL
ncbi:MAG: prepilin-type N-terminal cleavage/methylation domain-containing protein [Planctomycetota bacterium]|jgi:prepilin-type N-terminal cleavage/methylation domain-containing protein